MRLGELGAGQHTKFLIEPPAQVLMRAQRCRLLAHGRQGQHQPSAGLLIQRLTGSEVHHMAQHEIRTADLISQVGVFQHHHRARPARLHRRRMIAYCAKVGQRLAPPQPQRQLVGVAGSTRLTGHGRSAGIGGKLSKRQQVQLISSHA